VGGDLTVTRSAQFEEILIDDNFVTTTTSNTDLELRANGTGEILVPNNDVHITNDLTVDGTITVGDINSAGTITANRFTTGDILIDDNFITTTLSNSDLELRANGTGEVVVPSNDVTVEQNLTVNGNTTLKDTNVTGTITHVGNTTQTGDFNLTGNLDVDGNITIAGAVAFENIQIAGNVVETTLSNSDLELRANGTGEIVIPSNDVNIAGNLTVDGTLTVGDVVSTGTIQANRFTTGDILVDDNFITTTVSNIDLELRVSGTGSIVIDNFDINGSTISSSTDITLAPGSEAVVIDATGSVKLPVGDTSQRPTGVAGQIRFNSELGRFEGFNGTNWINLVGVEDLDGTTRITAELTEGANDDTIRFYNDDVLTIDITQDRLNANKITVDDIAIDGNVISTTTANTDLVLTANGTGSVTFDNFAFKDNTITNTVSNSVTTFEATDNGYVKFDGTYGLVIPSGGNTQRPPLAHTEVGQMRWNTDAQRTEIYDGANWVSVAGTQSGITRSEAEEIAFEIVLSLG
jgi:cytoskeletal protein CcmA (bactofilin family)